MRKAAGCENFWRIQEYAAVKRKDYPLPRIECARIITLGIENRKRPISTRISIDKAPPVAVVMMKPQPGRMHLQVHTIAINATALRNKCIAYCLSLDRLGINRHIPTTPKGVVKIACFGIINIHINNGFPVCLR